MGDFLLGHETSGTPLETRGGTSRIAGELLRMLSGQETGLGRLATESAMNNLGFDPAVLGIEGAARRALEDPASSTRGYFASLEPFERRQVDQNVAGLRGSFGQLGGRFSRNASEAEALLRGELANQFTRTRQEGLLAANAQQQDFLGNLLALLQGSQQNALAERDQILRFFAPGAPGYQEGALGDVIGGASNLAALQILAG